MNLAAITSRQLINRVVSIDSSKEQIALNLENRIVEAVRLDKFALPRIALSVTYGAHQMFARLVNLAPIIRPCSSASFIAPLDQQERASPMERHGSVAADSVVWGSEISVLLHPVSCLDDSIIWLRSTQPPRRAGTRRCHRQEGQISMNVCLFTNTYRSLFDDRILWLISSCHKANTIRPCARKV